MINDNKALKDEFSKEEGKGFQSRKKNMSTNKILEEEYGSHRETNHYLWPFLQSRSSHTTQHPTSLWTLKERLSRTLAHPESQVLLAGSVRN